jgi:hypothetical protein
MTVFAASADSGGYQGAIHPPGFRFENELLWESAIDPLSGTTYTSGSRVMFVVSSVRCRRVG